jgi:hypothetical protein
MHAKYISHCPGVPGKAGTEAALPPLRVLIIAWRGRLESVIL